jgi:hypothetical protein
MEYCLGDGDGSATMWNRGPDLDLDGDGRLDAVSLDFDGDGLADDALADLDGDGIADHAVLDLDNDGVAESYFTDDGSGTWSVAADSSARATVSPRFGCSTATATGWPTAQSRSGTAVRAVQRATSTPTAMAGGMSSSPTPTATAPPTRPARYSPRRRRPFAESARYCDGPWTWSSHTLTR